MTDFWLKTQDPAPGSTPGNGVASGLDIFTAALAQMTAVENANSAVNSLTEGYEEWRRRFKAGTGQTAPPNPMLAPNQSAPSDGSIVAQQRIAFAQFINEQAARFPAEAVRDWAQFDPVQHAESAAREADENLARLMESRPGWDKYIAMFAGAAVGSTRDPVQLGSMVLGGGPGAARTVMGRILTTAASEAVVNAGAEAVIQPQVQAWREQVGLEHGFEQAMTNVMFAAGLGGVLGAGGRGLAEAVDFARLTPEARAAMRPDLRGAIDAGNMLATVDAQRPPEMPLRRHEDLLTRTELIAHRQPIGPALETDEGQIARIVESLAPSAESISHPGYVPRVGEDFSATLDTIRTGDPAGAGNSARPVLRFLANSGGVDPASPVAAEMRAIGITSQSMPGIYRAGGAKALDNIPVTDVAEAFPGRADLDDGNGYVRDQAWLDAMQLELERRGPSFDAVQDERLYWERNGVDFDTMDDARILERMAQVADAEERYRLASEAADDVDEPAILLPPELSRRAYTDDAVRNAVRLAGPGVTDDVIRNAVNMHLFGGENLADAVDWAMSLKAGVARELPPPALEGIGSSPPAPRGDPVDPPDPDNGWSADLEALQEWAASEGLDDVAVPFGDELLTPAEIADTLNKATKLENVVANCRLY